MSDRVFFEWLEIERFRGFADPQRIDLGASVIVLWGPNGTGKTSFFDAIQWLLVGSIDRLESWRVRRNAEHIVNRYADASGDRAGVAAGIRIDGTEVEIRRTGRYDKSRLEWRGDQGTLLDEEAEEALARHLTPAGRMSLKRSLLSSGLLQQDVIREVLEDKPANRYDHLAAILGLDSIADFPAAARSRADRLAAEGEGARERNADIEARIRALEERIASLRSRQAKSPDVQQQQAELVRLMEPYGDALRLSDGVPREPREAGELRNSSGELAALLATLEEEAGELVETALIDREPSVDPDDFRRAAEAADLTLGEARAAAEEIEGRHREEEALADRMSRLATEALPLLGDVCPVCRQGIVEGDVHRHLEQLIGGGSAALQELEAERARVREAVRSAEEASEAARGALRDAERRAEEISSARSRRDRWRGRIEDVLGRYSDRLIFPMQPEILAGDVVALRALRAACEQLTDALTDLHAALSWNPETGAIATAEDECAELSGKAKETRDAAVAASIAEEEGKALQRAAVRAVTSLTEERFDVLRPVIQDIYGRLDPHPTFTRLRFAVEVYRERGIASPQVDDAHAGVEADPLLIFSSSQANVVALSAFLALGWASGKDSMPFLLLDDPLQSLDDVNALGFADLCRHMRGRRQLIVSTHDERLASLLTRKLAPRDAATRSRVLHFVAWNRGGPIIETSDTEPQLDQDNRLMLAAG
jgi:DNA repair exonuclease SbcCD ATPase subunit